MHHERGAGNEYYPFANETDFELGVWLHESGLSTAKINEFLSLEYVRLSHSLHHSLADICRLRPGCLLFPMLPLCAIESSFCLTEHPAGKSKKLLQITVLPLAVSPYFTGTP
jgi:hypothetical protein